MKGVAIAMIVMLAMVGTLMVKPGQAAITNCDQVIVALAPCAVYLVDGGNVPQACCTAVIKLKADAVTTQDKQKACTCAQEAAIKNPKLNEDFAKDLPKKCNVELDIPISRTTDCSSIKF